MTEIIGLHGKSYNGTPYTINIIINDGSVKELKAFGKPCKAVNDIVQNFHEIKAKNPQNIVDSIKLTMIQHNEYVQTVRK